MTRRHSPLRGGLSLALAGALLLTGGCRRAETDAFEVAVVGTGPLLLGGAAVGPVSEAQAVLRLNLAQGLVRFDSGGQVEPGLAERWNVSDDGLSYIFRLASGEWPDGRKIMARDIARIIKLQLNAKQRSATRDALGPVEDVVAMTDRVIEIRLGSPRANLLELLAQPEFALIREGVGSGPFTLRQSSTAGPFDASAIRMTRDVRGVDGDASGREEITLRTLPAPAAIAAFNRGNLDLLLGGTLADLPLATHAKLPRGALHFDPASGLFGLVPARADGPLAEPDVRRLLSAAIDRTALVGALAVPGLGPRSTLLQAGLEGLADPVQPPWLAQPVADRRPALQREAQRLFGNADRPRFRVALPEGPGGDLLFDRLSADWGAIGIGLERARPGGGADLKWIDAVAPSSSPAWFLRQFRCALVPICLGDADTLIEAARTAPGAAQRGALLGQAAAMMDGATLFIAIAAPVRWSLVGDRATGYQDNPFARHPFAGITRRSPRGY